MKLTHTVCKFCQGTGVVRNVRHPATNFLKVYHIKEAHTEFYSSVCPHCLGGTVFDVKEKVSLE